MSHGSSCRKCFPDASATTLFTELAFAAVISALGFDSQVSQPEISPLYFPPERKSHCPSGPAGNLPLPWRCHGTEDVHSLTLLKTWTTPWLPPTTSKSWPFSCFISPFWVEISYSCNSEFISQDHPSDFFFFFFRLWVMWSCIFFVWVSPVLAWGPHCVVYDHHILTARMSPISWINSGLVQTVYPA